MDQQKLIDDVRVANEENQRRINGLANSVDTVKAELSSMREQFGIVKGMAMSADRGYHTLSERVNNIATNQDRLNTELSEFKSMIIDKLDDMRKNSFKQMLGLMVYILGLISSVVAIFKYFFMT